MNAIDALTRTPAAPGGKAAKLPSVNEVAVKFESLLVSQMLNSMQNTVEKSGLLEGGSAEETYREMLNQALSDELARRGGLGLAEQIANRIREYQAAVHNAQQPETTGAHPK